MASNIPSSSLSHFLGELPALELEIGEGATIDISQSILPQDESNFMNCTKFTEVLGRGSYGIVLKGNNSQGPPSAFKIIFPEYSSPPELHTQEKKKILREVRNVADKRHHNIVTTIRFAERALNSQDMDKIFDDIELTVDVRKFVIIYKSEAQRLGSVDTICIQMELCGQTLRSWLNLNVNKVIDNELAEFQVGIIKGLMNGVGFLHNNKILHRDFKPDNIYFSPGDTLPVKIGDFGLSRELHTDKTNTLTSKVGTLDYMAPEVHTRDYSLQADLFSLGLVIWEVLQLISSRERKGLFDRLVYDKEESLVKEHPLVESSRGLIVNLTKRNISDRTKSIKDVRVRVKYIALNTKELRDRLNIANEGDIIELVVAKYDGPFFVRPRNIAIRGKGVGTVFVNGEPSTKSNRKSVLYISGEDCVVTNIKIISGPHDCGIHVSKSHSKIKDIRFEGGCVALNVKSEGNKLSNLLINNVQYGICVREGFGSNKLDYIVIQDVTHKGILFVGSNDNNEIHSVTCQNVKRNAVVVTGSYNKLSNIHCQNTKGIVDSYGVVIFDGTENSLDNIKCQNVKRAVEVTGSYNKLSNIHCQNTKDIVDSYGVVIFDGTENSLDNIKCSGFSKNGLYMLESSSRSKIRDSICDGVDVHGSENTLINVDAGREMNINGTGHRLENCTAEECDGFLFSVTFVGCHITPDWKLQLTT